MAVVVSDTSPLHYLILIGRESILESLYGQVFTPPGVVVELGHAAAPKKISAWASNPPSWVSVIAPTSVGREYDDLDFGERQALALAKEIGADLVLLDDKLARRHAEHANFKVKGTLGVVAAASQAGLIDFVETVESLQQTSMHLAPDLVAAVIAQYRKTIKRAKGVDGGHQVDV